MPITADGQRVKGRALWTLSEEHRAGRPVGAPDVSLFLEAGALHIVLVTCRCRMTSNELLVMI